jgi:16S rRNA processing protein RimM
MDRPAVVVGKITRAHGLKGEVSVEVRSDNPDRFAEGTSVLLEDGRPLTIARTHQHGKRLLLTFVGVEDRNAAEALQGRLLMVPEAWLPDLPDGEYWPHQLEGCAVVTESGRDLGVVVEVIANPANDLWVAQDADGTETLIPAIRGVVTEVAPDAKRILVRDVPGITAPEDEGESAPGDGNGATGR